MCDCLFVFFCFGGAGYCMLVVAGMLLLFVLVCLFGVRGLCVRHCLFALCCYVCLFALRVVAVASFLFANMCL